MKKMNHIDLVRKYLRYFNLMIGILMIVILSLNLEILIHSKRDLYENIQKNNDLLASVEIEYQCERCNRDSLNTLTRFCIEGALLATFLAFFSFLLSFRYDMFERNYKWFIPACLIETLIASLYFTFTSIQKLPDACRDYELKMKCDADFQYIFEYKLVPMSVIMLVLIPQFIFRSIYILVIKCSNRNKLQSIKRRSFRSKIFPSDLRPFNESITELDSTSFREVPIDCPQVEHQNAHQDENENLSRPLSYPIGRRVFNRNSSLSTIIEEKTMSSCKTATTTPGSSLNSNNNSEQHQLQQNTSALVVNEFLIDLKQHYMLINDINSVFSTHRTKDGEFSRNIAIRFKSHENSNNISSGSSSGYNTSPNKSNLGFDESKLLSVTTDNNNNNVKLSEEKCRFAKHLKNRIETKKGKAFNSHLTTSTSSISSVINSPICRVKKRNSHFTRQKNFSKRAIDFTKFRLAIDNFIENKNNKQDSVVIKSEANSSINNTSNNTSKTDDDNVMSNVSNFVSEIETDKSYLEATNLVVKSDVQPAYF